MRHKVFLGLGTNLGDREAQINVAVEQIKEKIGEVLAVSSLLETKPWGFDSENNFLNAAVCVNTELQPHAVLSATQEIEKSLGRVEKSHGGEYHDRVIDIDILIYDDIRIDEDDLKIPHPLMKERDFVMRPLAEIADIKQILKIIN